MKKIITFQLLIQLFFVVYSFGREQNRDMKIVSTQARVYRGEIISLDAKKNSFVIRSEKNKHDVVEFKDICYCENSSVNNVLELMRLPRLILSDGEIIIAQISKLENEKLYVYLLDINKEIPLAIDIVRVYINNFYIDNSMRTDETFLDKKNKTEDEIFFINGDSDRGTIASLSSNEVKLASTIYSKDKTYSLSKIAYISFAVLEEEKKLPTDIYGVFYLTNGGIIKGKLLGFVTSKELVEIDSFALGKLSIPLDLLHTFYFNNSNCSFLSDMKPVKVREELSFHSKYDPKFPFQKDRSSYNPLSSKLTPININGILYAKGLGVHAFSSLTYELSRKYSKFFATIGIDKSGRGRAAWQCGKATFVVEVDGKKVFEKNMKCTDKAKKINIDVKGAKTLTLIVKEHGGTFFMLARADWAMARLVR